MKKSWILLFLSFVTFSVTGQQITEYNKKGDEAIARANYSDAKMWYEEGVVNCDLYSIDKITQIWREKPEMRISMRSLVSKCYDCLTTKSAENDTIAIRNLIYYHKEGIGVPQNKTLASYWTQRLSYLSKNADLTGLYEQAVLKKDRQSAFFISYSYSIEAPFGISFGSVGKQWGWYVRAKSNLSFADSDIESNNKGFVAPTQDLYDFDKDKINCHIGTVGVIYKWTDQIHTSIGVGYGMRDLLWHYNIYTDDQKSSDGWSKNVEASYKGVVTEFDFIRSFGKTFVSTGLHTVNFKYVDLNAGIGVYF